jgi:hypothetical protein
MRSRALPSVRCGCPSYPSAVYSHLGIRTVHSYNTTSVQCRLSFLSAVSTDKRKAIELLRRLAAPGRHPSWVIVGCLTVHTLVLPVKVPTVLLSTVPPKNDGV